MERWRGIDAAPTDWGRCVVTIGVFDGVHRGHQAIIGHAIEIARKDGLPSVVLTFDPHPSEIVRPGSHPPRLTSIRRKADLVEELGVDVFCVQPFTLDFSHLAADAFVHELLVERLHVARIVVGENFRFGHRAAGNVDLLRELGDRFGFTVDPLPTVADGSAPSSLRTGTDGGTPYSSTYVRSCVDAGDVEAAAQALGRPHRLEGIVVRGEGRGAATLGFPTANLQLDTYAAVPADGVYAGHAFLGDERHVAAISIGTNPTFDGKERSVEAFLLDFDRDIYGDPIALDFTHRLRTTERFETIDALIEQMHRDVAEVRRLVG